MKTNLVSVDILFSLIFRNFGMMRCSEISERSSPQPGDGTRSSWCNGDPPSPFRGSQYRAASCTSWSNACPAKASGRALIFLPDPQQPVHHLYHLRGTQRNQCCTLFKAERVRFTLIRKHLQQLKEPHRSGGNVRKVLKTDLRKFKGI